MIVAQLFLSEKQVGLAVVVVLDGEMVVVVVVGDVLKKKR
jgi:hypothetical protein